MCVLVVISAVTLVPGKCFVYFLVVYPNIINYIICVVIVNCVTQQIKTHHTKLYYYQNIYLFK